jgi:uncharacterized protein
MTPLSLPDRAALLGIARGAILAHLGLGPRPALPASGALAVERGAFVTLHVARALRGCIGTFRPQSSLAATVARMAIAAATEDPRFLPIGAADLAELAVSVSALEAPRRLEDPRAVVIGREGLVVRRGLHRGALLPRVALEHDWGVEEFLKHACLKAGLPPRAWEDPEVEIEAFEADEFGEGVEA